MIYIYIYMYVCMYICKNRELENTFRNSSIFQEKIIFNKFQRINYGLYNITKWLLRGPIVSGIQATLEEARPNI